MRKLLTVTLSAAALMAGATGAANAETIYYTLPDMQTAKPLTLGQMIAYRMDQPQLSEFRNALQNARLSQDYDPNKGYTVFAVTNNANADGKSVDYYIVNDRVAVRTMGTANERTKTFTNQKVKTLSGDTLTISRLGSDYYVNNLLINDVQRNPEGLIYTVGGIASPAKL